MRPAHPRMYRVTYHRQDPAAGFWRTYAMPFTTLSGALAFISTCTAGAVRVTLTKNLCTPTNN